MSNKKARDVEKEQVWQAALQQLDTNLAIQRQSGT
jgi:hypothetical protein